MSEQHVIVTILPSGAELALVAYETDRLPRDVSAGEYFKVSAVFDAIHEFADLTVRTLKTLGPDEFELTFGVSVTAATGKLTALVVGGEAATSLTARLMWRRRDQEANT